MECTGRKGQVVSLSVSVRNSWPSLETFIDPRIRPETRTLLARTYQDLSRVAVTTWEVFFLALPRFLPLLRRRCSGTADVDVRARSTRKPIK